LDDQGNQGNDDERRTGSDRDPFAQLPTSTTLRVITAVTPAGHGVDDKRESSVAYAKSG
jgi:hypothetical protein